MASTASSSSFRTAESLDLSLLLVDKLQRSPRHIPRDVAQPIRRFEVCRLHERIDVGNFKHTLLPGNTHTVASLWDRHAGSCIHLVLQSSALARTARHLGRGYSRYSYASTSAKARIIIFTLSVNHNCRGRREPTCGIPD